MLKSFKNFAKELLFIISISITLFFLLYTFIIEPDKVTGVSMEPSFKDSDILLTDKIFYKNSGLKRGSVIVFKSPADNKTVFIKRIVGLPNESLRLKDNIIYIYNSTNPNGFPLEEPYLRQNTKTYPEMFLEEDKLIKIPEKGFFVLGDNRLKSVDSRQWGFVPTQNIIGKVIFRHWPPNTFGVIN